MLGLVAGVSEAEERVGEVGGEEAVDVADVMEMDEAKADLMGKLPLPLST